MSGGIARIEVGKNPYLSTYGTDTLDEGTAMEIRELPIQSIPVANIATARFSVSGRISLPVEPDELLYARFKHISGVPAADGSGSFSIERLRALDNLIDRLVEASGERAGVTNVAGMTADQIEALIERYQQNLHGALKEAPVQAQAAAGLVVNALA